VGRLKQDRWTGPDGKSHSRVTIVAEHVEFRPEFKKEGKTAATETIANQDISYDDYSEEDESILAVASKEIEPVVF
jgi:single-strand DNA-binding protein